MKDYAWRNKTSVSALVREILQDYEADPKSYRDVQDTLDPVPAVLTVYVPNEIWYAGRDMAYAHGRIPISALIRRGLIAKLMESTEIPA